MGYKDLEKRKAYDKAYYEANKERHNARSKAYYEANKDSLIPQVRAWIEENKEHVAIMQRARELYKKYGLTLEDYDRMLVAQNGVCAVCRKPPLENKHLVVDYNHVEGYRKLPAEEKVKYIRGLLHSNCNSVLGYAGDDPDVLNAAATYLKKFIDITPSQTCGNPNPNR